MMIKKKNAVIFLVVALIVTNSITFFLTNKIDLSMGNKYIITKHTYDEITQFSKMFAVKDMLEKNYVSKINESKLAEGAVRGLASGVGDPYTVYWDPKDFQANTITTEGEYAGVGLVVEAKDDNILIVSTIEGSPAEKAGIKSGDLIIGIDNKAVSGDSLDDAVSLMRGKAGTPVKITILKQGQSQPSDINIVRANIVMKSVSDKTVGNDIGYIKITAFQKNTAQEFIDSLKDLQNKNIKGLVIDLRNNGGGLLDQCTEIADALIGKSTIVYTIDNKGKKDVITSDKNKINVPYAILVNGYTASASEVVSGAVKDTHSGVLVGTKTFGKGIVQTILPFKMPGEKQESALKVTTAKYYTPSGVCIQGIGIQPNYTVDLPDNLKQKPELTLQEDVQLQKAMSVVESELK
ncbi:MAG TPA: S41 family peptidase [Clostridiaceae bacterium]|nr:S41 family peptidase [Clostridiaceae bacterium]